MARTIEEVTTASLVEIDGLGVVDGGPMLVEWDLEPAVLAYQQWVAAVLDSA